MRYFIHGLGVGFLCCALADLARIPCPEFVKSVTITLRGKRKSWFTYKVITSKVMGGAICDRGLLRFATGGVAFCDRGLLHFEGVFCAALRAVFTVPVPPRYNATGLKGREVPRHRRLVHLALFGQLFEAGEASAGLAVVVVGQPVKHYLASGFQAGLLHRKSGHVVAHSVHLLNISRST